MTARSPQDPASDREQRSPRDIPGATGNELPAQREERSGRGTCEGAGNELPGSTDTDRAISRVATAQSGAVGYGQLTDAGLRHSAIGKRSDRGVLHRIHRVVY